MPLSRVVRTLADLRPRQVGYQAVYRLTAKLSKRPTLRCNASWKISLPLSQALRRPTGEPCPEATFRFLNREVAFANWEHVNWDFCGYGKLFAYHLNYFDDLLKGVPPHWVRALQAYAAYRPPRSNKYEPYPTSLRLVNSVAFYGLMGEVPSSEVADDLFTGYHDLWSKLEHHLSGNHLLENALALVAGAAAFGDHNGQRKAKRLLASELTDQYLPDGLHYERSFTYHALLCYRQLIVLAILEASESTAEVNQTIEIMRERLPPQLACLRRHLPSSNAYPRFNDIDPIHTPRPDYLFGIADGLGLTHGALSQSTHRTEEDTYITFDLPRYHFTVDVGHFGPKHIPGHAHCDALSFVLCDSGGRELITEVGTSTYEASETRLRERGTKSHNTVAVGDVEQAEIWGAFRAGRKPKVKLICANEHFLAAEVRVRCSSVASYTHRRVFEAGNDTLCIRDSVEGEISATAEARLHLTPGIEVEIEEETVRLGSVARITFTNALLVEREPYDYAVGFNMVVGADVLVITFYSTLTTTIHLS